MKYKNMKNFIKTGVTMNNTHLNWLIAILLCANASIPSLVNAKSKELAREKIAVNAIHLSNPITVTKNNLVAVLQKKNNLVAVLQKKYTNQDLLIDLALKNSTTASDVISLVTQKNLAGIAKTKPGDFFLCELIEKNPAITVPHLISLVTEKNLVDLALRIDCAFLFKLINKNPAITVPHLTSLVTKDNFDYLARCLFLHKLIEKSQDAAVYFTSLITEKNFSVRTGSRNDIYLLFDLYLLRKLIEKNPDAATYFTSLVTEKNIFGLIVNSQDDHYFLCDLVEKNPDAAAYFASLITEKNFFNTKDNPFCLASSREGYHFISKLIEKNPNTAVHFTNLAGDNLVTLVTDKYTICNTTTYIGSNFLESLVEANPTALSHFASLVTIKNWFYLVRTEFGRRILGELVRRKN